ncbi:MAG: Holliday junction branch migration protein RuvA [Desulfobulbaceae bacterium]|nr:MAG: Holliday junction branch migration protein RuvA [Desulfobulbaceae bacterium]
MIAALSGIILHKGSDRAIIDVSGVGYEVFLTTEALAKLPEKDDPISLFIHTHVREDAIVLYGFLEEKEKEMYLILTTVSGVGPKLGMAILSGMRVDDLCRAISGKQIKLLTALQGVGKKTAERICVDLKDKVGHLFIDDGFEAQEGEVATASATSSTVMDALSALTNLGYSDPVSRQALSNVKKRLGDQAFFELTVEELLRECLRALA